MNSSLPTLQPRLLLGLRTDVEGNAQYITDEEIIYPVAGVLSIHNHTQKRQKFFKLADKGQNLTSLVISNNKLLLAVLESGSKPSVTFYCLITFKKKRQVVLPIEKDNLPTRIMCGSFTFDDRKMAVVTGDPDWMLYFFRSDKGKVESTAKALYMNNTGIVKHIACNPNDANLLALVGENLIRIMASSECSWRQFGFAKGEKWSFASVAWVTQERLLAGTVDGMILLIESGDLKAVFQADDLNVIEMKPKDDLQQLSKTSLDVPSGLIPKLDDDYSIRSLLVFPRGLAFGYKNGLIHVFETESPTRYVKKGVYRIPDHTIIRDNEEIDRGMTTVHCIDISPDQRKILVTCGESQIYTGVLWEEGNEVLTEYGFPLHSGAIGSMAVCCWKPLLLTAGKEDRTLKLWNYDDQELELMQKFKDDIYATALHPSGLYAIVGFSDKLRFLTITIDEFNVTREFGIRLCQKCSFSKMGHLFAASNGNVIQVYSSNTFELLYTLKGHSGKISGISWTVDDKKMASCGDEGSAYEWLVAESKREFDFIMKKIKFNGTVISSDGKSIYVISSDGYIRELKGGIVNRDCPILEGELDSIALSRLDQMLFLSGNSGTIYNLKLPLMDKADFVEYNIHSSKIEHMAISYDDRHLFTASTDGSICFWKISNAEGKAVKMDKDFEPSTDILIKKQFLEDKINQVKNLQMRLEEMESEYAYQLRQNDTVNALRMQEIHAGYCDAIEELKTKNNQLEMEHQDQIDSIHEGIQEMRKDNEKHIKDLELTFNEKLIIEYEKHANLEGKMERMRLGYEKDLDDLRKEKKTSEDAVTNKFLEKLQDKQIQHEELMEKMNHQNKLHEVIKKQIEEDSDREICQLNAKHNQELKEEQNLNVKTRGELSMVKKKWLTAQKESDQLKGTVNTLDMTQKKFRREIVNLDQEKADLKKEIVERDLIIQDKEKRVYDLKNKNQELEKYKFIMEFKIKELKSQIEPKEKMIVEQAEQVNAMVRELENLQKVILSLDLQLQELKEKLLAADTEVRKEVAKNYGMKREVTRMKTEIYKASGYIHNVPLLIACIRQMYHKFNIDDEFILDQSEDGGAKNEFLRQRDFLERTVNVMKVRVDKSKNFVGDDKIKLTEENTALLEETNELRRMFRSEKKMRITLEQNLKSGLLPPVNKKNSLGDSREKKKSGEEAGSSQKWRNGGSGDQF